MHPADRLHALPPEAVRFRGAVDERIRLSRERHLRVLDPQALTAWFRERPDPFACGEFWGKTVRAACPLYRHAGDAELRERVWAMVDALLATQDADGCISTQSRARQPLGSDLWERKYVLLGLLAWYEAEGDARALDAALRLADHVLSLVGPAPRRRIVDTGWAFAGIESSSILEPILRLHRLTGAARLLDFARYIVEDEGACGRGSIFAAALAGVLPRDIGGNGYPAQSIAKAYESMSCFEGLVEYHRATGERRWLDAAIAYHHALREREITIIGSGGGEGLYNRGPGTGEQWNDTALDQADPALRLQMETCVTVTWMKLCLQLLRATGDPRYADDIEESLHNALMGAQRPDGSAWDYFQTLCGTRGGADNFASDVGGFRLSCCTANGPMGYAILPGMAVMRRGDGLAVNLYLPGTVQADVPGAGAVRLDIDTGYPADGRIALAVRPQHAARFTIALRIPGWSASSALRVGGESFPAQAGTYAVIEREWRPGERIELELDLAVRRIAAPRGACAALRRGPLVLARDLRLGGDPDAVVRLSQRPEATMIIPGFPVQAACRIADADGRALDLIDYASAGRTWGSDSRLRVWLPSA
ncbi:MAG: glycoside hydrolase family 127 protein [Planctomycetes bacterium]|nr:glycoside hydrolase family 127 protein [Planctomycetota bacterium]